MLRFLSFFMITFGFFCQTAFAGYTVDGTWTNITGSGGGTPTCLQTLTDSLPVPVGDPGGDSLYDIQIRYGFQEGDTDCSQPRSFPRYLTDQSGLGFDGGQGPLNFNAPDCESAAMALNLGLATHFNNSIQSYSSLTGADLNITVNWTGDNPPATAGSQTVPQALTFEETPNTPPCAYPNPPGPDCNDRITLGSAVEIANAVDDNGLMCDITILGFTDCDNLNPGLADIQTEYITNEGSQNDTCLFARSTDSIPVTLSSVATKLLGSTLEFDWQTSTETFTLGFNLWGLVDEEWHQLNKRLVPSRQTDSLSPQQYNSRVKIINLQGPVEAVGVSSVDTDGTEDFYGPFEPGEQYGEVSLPEPIPWDEIQQEVTQRMIAAGYVKVGQRWRRIGSAAARKALAASGLYPNVDLTVATPGMQRVTYDALLAAGIDLNGVSLNYIAVTHKGRPVARFAKGKKGKFGPGGHIDFYGQKVTAEDALYTLNNVYRIQIDSALVWRAGRIKRAPDAPEPFYQAKIETDENKTYSFILPGKDPWYDRSALAYGGNDPQAASMEMTVVVDHLIADQPTVLTLGLVGVSSFKGPIPDHMVQVFVNGQLVTTEPETADGLVDWKLELPLAAGILQNGENSVVVEVPGVADYSWDMVLLDRYGVKYPRAFVAQGKKLEFDAEATGFAVSGFNNRRIVAYAHQDGNLAHIKVFKKRNAPGDFTAKFSGVAEGEATYWVSSVDALQRPQVSIVNPGQNLLSPADFIIIAHPAFQQRLESPQESQINYISTKEAEGYTVKVVNVEDIFAEYGYGMPLPGAIRDYLKAANAAFEYQHVLLVGGATSDPHNYTGSDSINFIPTPYAHTGEFIYYTPSDALMVDLDGDELPDKAIGRWPVRTADDLDAMITKSSKYEENLPDALAHKASALLIAASPDESQLLSFEQQIERIQRRLVATQSDGSLNPWTDITKVYEDDYADIADAREAIKDAINSGMSMTIFSGHGSPSAWSRKKLMTWQVAQELANEDLPTLMMVMACYTTYYVSPTTDTLAHQLLVSGNRGAVAIQGAVVYSEYAQNELMGIRVLDQMLQNGETLGEAIRLAKQDLGEDYRDTAINWQLNGDPTLRVEPENVSSPPDPPGSETDSY